MNGSDEKHSARRDDAMKHETEGLVRGGHGTRAEEWRDAEPSGEDQPLTDAVRGADRGAPPPGMSSRDVEARTEIARFLGRLHRPADRNRLLRTAEGNQAPEEVLAELRRLPPDRRFATVQEVMRALGYGTESHRV